MQPLPLIINCSTDRAFCRYGENEYIIPYKDLERTLPKLLGEILETDIPSSLIVVNGPGGFTSLRIGALSAGLIATEHALPVYSWTKIDLYKHCYDNGLLPQQGYVTIGQRKNVWLYNFATMSAEIVRVVDDISLPEEYFVDMVDEHLLLEKVSDDKKVVMKGSNEGLFVEYEGKAMVLDRELLTNSSHQTEKITPDYMIEPTLG